MNILIIPAFFQTKRRPTVGSFFLEQAKALKKAGHQVTILYCDTYSVKCIREWIVYEEQTTDVIDNIKVYRKKTFCPFKHGMEGHRKAFARGILSLYESQIKGRMEPDILHAHCCVWAGQAAMALSQQTGIPYLITEHATMFQLHRDQISRKNNQYITQAFQRAAKVLCVSSAFRDVLAVYRAPQEIQVVGNVVDCDFFHQSDTKTANFTFFSLCYMQTEDQLRKKGIDILLRAWRTVQRNCPLARLVVGGGGQALQKAVKWCEEYEISDTVTFLGALDRQQTAHQMASCDCFVLPSRYETFGVVYIEAMACGNPVIATACGGPDDFVTPDNGLLVPVEDVSALEQAMQQMITSSHQYDSDKIRASVASRFSSQAVAGQLERIYHAILEESSGSMK